MLACKTNTLVLDSILKLFYFYIVSQLHLKKENCLDFFLNDNSLYFAYLGKMARIKLKCY